MKNKIFGNMNISFSLDFTTSKLLGYLILLSTSILGYVLKNSDVVIIGVISSSALAGAKSLSDNWVRIKGPNGNKINNIIETVEDAINNENNLKDNK